MIIHAIRERWNALYAGIASIMISARSTARGLPLLVSRRPQTPLRVLCIMAFDMLHRLRNAAPLPAQNVRMLAALLDLGACANAVLDHKECCRHEYRRTLQSLEAGGIRSSVLEYLRRLEDLESKRPWPGGDFWQFQKVQSYREAVVRLSLGIVSTAARCSRCLEEGIRATCCDVDLKTLFRIVMLCQIIDDVLDYSKDVSAGLPSFLTATKSLSQALELTRLATLDYADDCDLPRTGDLLLLRSALFLVAACAKLVMAFGRWRLRAHVSGVRLRVQISQ